MAVAKKAVSRGTVDIDEEIEEQKKKLAELEQQKAEVAEAEACFNELAAVMKDANEALKQVPGLLKKITLQKNAHFDRDARRSFIEEFEKLDFTIKTLNPDRFSPFASAAGDFNHSKKKG